MNDNARILAESLRLAPHPEGGLFRETFRAADTVRTDQGLRSASTAIYFLLPAATFSALHRIRSDEVWHHYDGDPVTLHTIDDLGEHRVVRLGRDVGRGEQPQCVVAAGLWQAAVPIGTRFALCGCTVAPGFDFADFELASRDELGRQYPQHRSLIDELTR